MRALVWPGLVEPNCEGRDWLAAVAAAKAKQNRRVEPATDIAHDRHVATEPAFDGLLEQRLELVDQGRRVVEPAFGASVGEVEVPVAVLRHATVTNLEEMSRRQRL